MEKEPLKTTSLRFRQSCATQMREYFEKLFHRYFNVEIKYSYKRGKYICVIQKMYKNQWYCYWLELPDEVLSKPGFFECEFQATFATFCVDVFEKKCDEDPTHEMVVLTSEECFGGGSTEKTTKLNPCPPRSIHRKNWI
jgi:hypothetical protein